MREVAVTDDAALNPKHWRAWLTIGSIGFAATIGAAFVFGLGPLDVLLLRVLLREPAIAPFAIVDYVLIAIGVIQMIRHLSARSP
jgi:hypothetical protein